MKKLDIAPSILNAPFDHIESILDRLYFCGAKYLHYDVMDGHFVPNLSFGSDILKSINKEHKLINDVHLMVDNPFLYIEQFKNAKADIITVHYEAFNDLNKLNECIDLIHSLDMKCGVSIKPSTDVKVLFPLLNKLDLILIMSVEPGFGGQAFNPKILKNIEVLDTFRKKEGLFYLVEVDGGINNTTIKEVYRSGADIAVVGSYLFKNNLEEAYINLMEELK